MRVCLKLFHFFSKHSASLKDRTAWNMFSQQIRFTGKDKFASKKRAGNIEKR